MIMDRYGHAFHGRSSYHSWSCTHLYQYSPLTASTHVDLLPDQGLLAEDTDTVLTRDPGLAQGTGHTETDEPSSLHLLYTLIDEWDTVGNVKVVRSRLVGL
jgi:ribosomal protein L11 methylase PrmA